MAAPSEQKIVAIHQPNYFPWLGYFYKIYASDVFVFHDNVEHSKRYPTRRTRIRAAQNDPEPIWLTVPLKKHSDFALIKDLEIDDKADWPEKHLRKLKISYAAAPLYGAILPKMEHLLGQSARFERLADLNIFLLKNMLDWLDFQRPMHRSSDIQANSTGSNYNIELARSLGGTAYLSGKGGGNYQSEDEFSAAGITLKYSHFASYFDEKHPELPMGLSILDGLFYLGIEGVINCLESCPQN